MQHSSPQQFKPQIPPTNYHTHHQIGMLPLGPSFFGSSYDGEHQPPMSFYEGSTSFDGSWRVHQSWQIPPVEYISDVQPNDGTYAEIEKMANKL